jgi:hypothetical protein
VRGQQGSGRARCNRNDERYMARWWKSDLSFFARPDAPSNGIKILRPRTSRTTSFDLFQSGPSVFLEFAQTPTTAEGIKAFADRYGLLMQDGLWTHDVNSWVATIREMRRTVRLWEKSKTTGDFTKIIRVVEQLFLRGDPVTPGVEVKVLLKKKSPKCGCESLHSSKQPS